MYYRGATAAIIVYDVTSKSSFEGAKSWVKELQRRGDPHCVIALAANKADLEGKRKVSKEEGDEYAGSNDIIHMQTSAKTGMNIKNLFFVSENMHKKVHTCWSVVFPFDKRI